MKSSRFFFYLRKVKRAERGGGERERERRRRGKRSETKLIKLGRGERFE